MLHFSDMQLKNVLEAARFRNDANVSESDTVFVTLCMKCSAELNQGLSYAVQAKPRVLILRKLELWRHVDLAMTTVLVGE
jgi:hypothetical protein